MGQEIKLGLVYNCLIASRGVGRQGLRRKVGIPGDPCYLQVSGNIELLLLFYRMREIISYCYFSGTRNFMY